MLIVIGVTIRTRSYVVAFQFPSSCALVKVLHRSSDPNIILPMIFLSEENARDLLNI